MAYPTDPLSFTHRRHAFAEAAASFVGSVFLSLLLGQFLSWTRDANFVPLAALDAIDRDVSQLLTTTPKLGVPLAGEFRRVVFLDVDDDTMTRYVAHELDGFTCADCAFAPGQSTPRDLLAELVARVRAAGARVVFVDIDLRDSRAPAGDARLRDELGRAGTPVTLLRYVHPAPGEDCGAGAASRTQAFATIVDDRARSGAVEFVHPYLMDDVLGNANAICPEVRASSASRSLVYPSAAARVLALAGVPGTCRRPDEETARPIGFHAPAGVQQLVATDGGAPVYLHVPAHRLFWNPTDALSGAIVVIGASHIGSADLHSTAIGTMPGALIHANAMLDFQACDVKASRPVLGFFVEFALTLALAAVYAYFYVYRGALAAHAHGSAWRRALSRTFVFIVTLGASLVVGGLYYVFVVPAVPTGEVAVVAPFVALCGEVLYEVLKTLNQGVERFVLRWLGAGHG